MLFAGCYAAIRAGLDYAPPFRFAALRASLGGTLLLALLALRGLPILPPRRLWSTVVILALIGTTLGFAVMGLMGIEAAYPDAKVSDVLTPGGLEKTEIVDQKCYGAVLDAFKLPVDQVIAKNPSEVPPFPDLFVADTPGSVPTDSSSCSWRRTRAFRSPYLAGSTRPPAST